MHTDPHSHHSIRSKTPSNSIINWILMHNESTSVPHNTPFIGCWPNISALCKTCGPRSSSSSLFIQQLYIKPLMSAASNLRLVYARICCKWMRLLSYPCLVFRDYSQINMRDIYPVNEPNLSGRS